MIPPQEAAMDIATSNIVIAAIGGVATVVASVGAALAARLPQKDAMGTTNPSRKRDLG
jgi:hypothetical protein